MDLSRSAFRPQKFCTDLRTIAMREHDPVTGSDQADDLGYCPLSVCPLFSDRSLLSRANQGVATHGKEHGLYNEETTLVLQLSLHFVIPSKARDLQLASANYR